MKPWMIFISFVLGLVLAWAGILYSGSKGDNATRFQNILSLTMFIIGGYVLFLGSIVWASIVFDFWRPLLAIVILIAICVYFSVTSKPSWQIRQEYESQPDKSVGHEWTMVTCRHVHRCDTCARSSGDEKCKQCASGNCGTNMCYWLSK